MMEGVKRGGDRQALHEIIRTCSMAATARMKEGEPCDLLSRLAAEPAFGMTEAEMEAVLDPKLYIGRCPEQVDAFLAQVRPLLSGASRFIPSGRPARRACGGRGAGTLFRRNPFGCPGAEEPGRLPEMECRFCGF